VAANPHRSTGQNLSTALLEMPKWFYFSGPRNMACHDLTTDSTPPPTFCSLLGLGLNFCVTPETTTTRMEENLERFCQDLYLRVFFAGSDLPANKLFVNPNGNRPPRRSLPNFVPEPNFSREPSKDSFEPSACPQT
jgi:hypothetical protein